jgi:LPPG:FO 2-phospho-L-lactate transferase
MVSKHQSVVALAGGVGGAKMAQGLALALPPGDLTVIVNTADDFEHLGLKISPDLDTVLYTLGGIANPATGWGIAGDTRHLLDAAIRLGGPDWFLLGDQDLATHVLRTQQLRQGSTLTEVTAGFAERLGIASPILPMTDDPVATLIRTGGKLLDFQDYFVRRHQEDAVDGVELRGIDAARPGPDVLAAVAGADLIVFCPSNPIVSIGPILAIPGIRDALMATPAVKIAVSPIVGGKALKGPADKMLQTLGHEVSALGVARLYGGLIDGYVIDTQDAELQDQIAATGLQVLATQSIMGGPDDRRRLAAEILEFGRSLLPVVGARS